MAATIERPSRWYTSRESAKSLIGLNSTITDKDARIDKLIARASRHIEKFTKRFFLPRIATYEFDYQGPSEIILGKDLISVTSITHGDGTKTIASGDYFLYPLNALDEEKPYLRIEILTTDDYLYYDDSRQSAIAIAGKWGYSEILHRVVSQLNDADGISASDTAIIVDDGTEFDIGQLILMGTEMVWIQNIATHTLTCKRGMFGSTAAIHLNNVEIDIILPPEDIQMACESLVARWLNRGDAAWSDRTGTKEAGFTYFNKMPKEVQQLLSYYRRLVG